MDAQRAYQLGFVNRVFAANDLMKAAEGLAEGIFQNAPPFRSGDEESDDQKQGARLPKCPPFHGRDLYSCL